MPRKLVGSQSASVYEVTNPNGELVTYIGGGSVAVRLPDDTVIYQLPEGPCGAFLPMGYKLGLSAGEYASIDDTPGFSNSI